MGWKKNGFSYILWMIFSAAVLAGILGLAAFVCNRYALPVEYALAEYALVATIIFFLLIGSFVFLTARICRKRTPVKERNNTFYKVVEAFLLVLFIAGGVYLRISKAALFAEPESGMEYFRAAAITADSAIPQVVHGGTYLYLHLLRGLFFLLGNKLYVAYGLQLILQILSGVFFFFAVRRLSGGAAALIMSGFWMLSSYVIGESMRLSPAMLLLFLYGVVLCMIAGCLTRPRHFLWILLCGILTGIVAYLDVVGISLILFWLGVFSVIRKDKGKKILKRYAVFLTALAGGAAGFALSIWLDAYLSGKSFLGILNAWAMLYMPEKFVLSFTGEMLVPENIFALAEIILLFLFLSVGCFGFWCSKRTERQGPWIAVTIILFLLQCLQMQKQNEGSEIYVSLFLTILAGSGIRAVFSTDCNQEADDSEVADDPLCEPEMEDQLEEEFVIVSEENPIEENPIEENQIEENQIEENQIEEIQVEEILDGENPVDEKTVEEIPEIHFLENPLPVPKKHEPRTFEYPVDVAEERYSYDYDVDEDDDFDI